MDISVEKLDLIQQILLIRDEKIIQAISKLIEKGRITSNEVDGWEDLPTFQKEAIEKGMQQMEAGQGIPLDEVLARFR